MAAWRCVVEKWTEASTPHGAPRTRRIQGLDLRPLARRVQELAKTEYGTAGETLGDQPLFTNVVDAIDALLSRELYGLMWHDLPDIIEQRTYRVLFGERLGVPGDAATLVFEFLVAVDNPNSSEVAAALSGDRFEEIKEGFERWRMRLGLSEAQRDNRTGVEAGSDEEEEIGNTGDTDAGDTGDAGDNGGVDGDEATLPGEDGEREREREQAAMDTLENTMAGWVDTPLRWQCEELLRSMQTRQLLGTRGRYGTNPSNTMSWARMQDFAELASSLGGLLSLEGQRGSSPGVNWREVFKYALEMMELDKRWRGVQHAKQRLDINRKL